MNPELLAVLAGVVRCVQETEAQAEANAEAARPAPPATNLWALNGRQSIMHMRALVQQRVLRR